MSETSRRSILSALAATTAAAAVVTSAAAVKAPMADDPVYALIAAHKEARTALDAHRGPEDLPDELLDAEMAARWPFVEHDPVTLPGLVAYVHHAASYPDMVVMENAITETVLSTIASALDRLLPNGGANV